jgi:hypothetical protein
MGAPAFPYELTLMTRQPKVQAFGDGIGGFGYHRHYYTCKRNKNEVGKKQFKEK